VAAPKFGVKLKNEFAAQLEDGQFGSNLGRVLICLVIASPAQPDSLSSVLSAIASATAEGLAKEDGDPAG
jgi:hypothetical protein